MPLFEDINKERDVASDLSDSIDNFADRVDDLDDSLKEMIVGLERHDEAEDDLYDIIQDTITNLQYLRNELR